MLTASYLLHDSLKVVGAAEQGLEKTQLLASFMLTWLIHYLVEQALNIGSAIKTMYLVFIRMYGWNGFFKI
jgi:hypothetical protein